MNHGIFYMNLKTKIFQFTRIKLQSKFQVQFTWAESVKCFKVPSSTGSILDNPSATVGWRQQYNHVNGASKRKLCDFKSFYDVDDVVKMHKILNKHQW